MLTPAFQGLSNERSWEHRARQGSRLNISPRYHSNYHFGHHNIQESRRLQGLHRLSICITLIYAVPHLTRLAERERERGREEEEVEVAAMVGLAFVCRQWGKQGGCCCCGDGQETAEETPTIVVYAVPADDPATLHQTIHGIAKVRYP